MLTLRAVLSWCKPKSQQPLAVTFDRPLCFLHIPKTGGITVRRFLSQKFPEDQTYDVAAVPSQDVRALYDSRQYLAYVSHIPYPWFRQLPRMPLMFTILRDPCDRAVSHFYFVRQLIEQQLQTQQVPEIHAKVCACDFGEFLRSEPIRSQIFFGELQTRMFANPGPCWQLSDFEPNNPIPTLTRDDVRIAKQRLKECIVVGLSHRLLESIQLVCDAFGWERPNQIGIENATTNRPQVEQLDAGTLRLLRQITACDQELFDYAIQLFEAKNKTIRRRLVD